jgi:hypothetical protein
MIQAHRGFARFFPLGLVALAFACAIPAGVYAQQNCNFGSPCASGYTCNASGHCVLASGGSGNTSGGTLFNPLGPNADLNTFITNILTLVTDVIGPIVVVFMVVYSGFLYVVARGNPGKVGAAHQALLWTVIGGLVLLGAKAIQLIIVATVQGLSG